MTLPTLWRTVGALLALSAAAAVSLHLVQASQQRSAAAAAPPAPYPGGQVSFAPGAPQLASLKIAAALAAPLPLTEPLNGRIVYDENRTARVSSPIAGRITALRAEQGDLVRAGAVLALIDAPDLATAEADWRKARADEERKRLAYQRSRDLFDAEVLARKDYEAAQADFEQAAAESRRAARRLRSLNAGGGEDGAYGLRAPIGGVIAERQLNPGLEVRPDLAAPLFVVTDLHHLWLLVDLPETSAAAVHAGQRVSLETDGLSGQQFTATVEHVGLTLDPATHRVQVRCSVDNADLKLRPEMFARVSFLSNDDSRRGVPLPNASLFVDGMNEFVFVETSAGKFKKRQVHVALHGRDASFVDAGLASGERVVTEGALLLNAEAGAHAR